MPRLDQGNTFTADLNHHGSTSAPHAGAVADQPNRRSSFQRCSAASRNKRQVPHLQPSRCLELAALLQVLPLLLISAIEPTTSTAVHQNTERASGAVRAGGAGGLTLLSVRRGANSSIFPPTSPAVTTIAASTSKDSLGSFCMARPCNLSN